MILPKSIIAAAFLAQQVSAVCRGDNLLNAFIKKPIAAHAFCSTYTQGLGSPLPTFAPTTYASSRYSSACSCIATTTTTTSGPATTLVTSTATSTSVSTSASNSASPCVPTTVTLPPSTVTLPASTIILPPSTETLPASTVTLPASTVTLPPSTETLPASTITLSPSTETLPASTITLPPSTEILPASTVTVTVAASSTTGSSSTSTSTTSTSSAAACLATSVIANGGFENSPKDILPWTITGGAEQYIWDYVHSGVQSVLAYHGSGSPSFTLAQNVTVCPNTAYSFSFWVSNDGETGHPACPLQVCFDANCALVVTIVDANTVFQQYSRRYVGANTDTVQVKIFTTSCPQFVLFDDAAFVTST